MTLTLDLTPAEEAQIDALAQGRGTEPADFVETLVRAYLPEAPTPLTAENDPTLALLATWLREDATDSAEAIQEAEKDLREFKRNMNQSRREAGARLLFPETE